MADLADPKGLGPMGKSRVPEFGNDDFKSSWQKLIVPGLIVIVLAGIGWFIYANKDSLFTTSPPVEKVEGKPSSSAKVAKNGAKQAGKEELLFPPGSTLPPDVSGPIQNNERSALPGTSNSRSSVVTAGGSKEVKSSVANTQVVTQAAAKPESTTARSVAQVASVGGQASSASSASVQASASSIESRLVNAEKEIAALGSQVAEQGLNQLKDIAALKKDLVATQALTLQNTGELKAVRTRVSKTERSLAETDARLASNFAQITDNLRSGVLRMQPAPYIGLVQPGGRDESQASTSPVVSHPSTTREIQPAAVTGGCVVNCRARRK